MRSSIDNLHKGRDICIVKYNIISTIPDCPDQSTDTNSYPCLDRFANPVQPVSKHILNITRGRHIEGEVNNSPYEGCEFAFEEEVFYGLFFITKSAIFAAIPASFSQAVLG
jgi:hypothetical protein